MCNHSMLQMNRRKNLRAIESVFLQTAVILSQTPVTQRLHSLCMSVSACTKIGLHCVFKHLDRYITGARLKITTVCPKPFMITSG